MRDDTVGPLGRTGSPDGPPAILAMLQVEVANGRGEKVWADFLQPQGETNNEVQLLRALCDALGVQWGEDEYGWWAVVPSSVRHAAEQV